MTAEQKFDLQFGQRVAAARTAHDLSQRALAGELAKFDVTLDSAALSRLEQGKRAPKLHEAVAIAGVLGVPLGELLPAMVESPKESLVRTWSTIQRDTDDALYKLTALVGHLNLFASLIEEHPEAADEIWGEEGENDWQKWMRWTASSLTRYSPERVLMLPADRYAQLVDTLEFVARSVVKLEGSGARTLEGDRFSTELLFTDGLPDDPAEAERDG